VTPATGAERPATRDAIVRTLALGTLGDIQVEVEGVVKRAEDQAGDAVGAGHVVRLRNAACAFDQREHASICNDSRNGLHLRRGLGLGQHDARNACIAQQVQVVVEGARLRVVDAHDNACTVCFSSPP
jgi:hypothetical protein